MSAFEKIVRPGTLPYGKKRISVFCKIVISDDGRLSITGVEGPRSNGDAYGSCGQIDMHYAHRHRDDDDPRYGLSGLTPVSDIAFAEGWDAELWFDFLYVWKRYHMNGTTAECEHQRALGWTCETHEGRACLVCGYEIGTERRREELPEAVRVFLASLPDTDKTPAWV